jgi:hypothetical protein
MNEHLALICGKSGSGKSASLRNLRDPESVLYLNCEAGKRLPFPAKFVQRTVTNPNQVKEAFAWAEKHDNIKVIVIDTLTFWLDMYISQYVKPAADGRAAWGNFAEFFKSTMQVDVAKSTKKVIFLAHTLDTYNETAMVMETAIPVAGSLKNQGIEAYFSLVLMCQKVKISDLVEGSPLLKITDKERAVGFKHVYQTEVTKDTLNTRIRGPMLMWADNEVFIDNDIQNVIDRMDEYYV